MVKTITKSLLVYISIIESLKNIDNEVLLILKINNIIIDLKDLSLFTLIYKSNLLTDIEFNKFVKMIYRLDSICYSKQILYEEFEYDYEIDTNIQYDNEKLIKLEEQINTKLDVDFLYLPF